MKRRATITDYFIKASYSTENNGKYKLNYINIFNSNRFIFFYIFIKLFIKIIKNKVETQILSSTFQTCI